MKIAIDCRMIGSGGIGSYLLALLPFFIKNHDCLLFGNEENIKSYVSSSDCRILSCDVSTFSIKELISFPKSLIKEINCCDIYYSPYCNIPSGIKIPVYSTIHDVVFLDVPGLSGKIGTIARKWFYQHAYNKSKVVFTVSEFSKSRIQMHLKTRKVPTIVTYNAIPYWFTENIDSNVQKDNSILFVGNIKKHKGLSTLLSAFSKLLDENFDAKLVIVGNANNFRTGDVSIADKISKLPQDRVEFTGRVSDSQLKNYYQKARILVQPSLYEGFGMPPMEALVLGTNAVISDIPVFKEIYVKLPVTFFQTENSDDLADKIKNTFNKTNPVISENPYSFDRTYEIINNTIQGK